MAITSVHGSIYPSLNHIWFTSDSHWNHANILRYCGRPFASIDQMNECFIENWNKVVGPDDHVYHLGDMFFKDFQKSAQILHKLNGFIHLIRGNHYRTDEHMAKCHPYKIAWFKDYFELKVNDPTPFGARQMLVLFHYAMVTWNRSHYSSILAHGHSHSTLNSWIEEHMPHARMLDVGVDSVARLLAKQKGHENLLQEEDYRPISYAEVKLFLKDKIGHSVDHHKSPEE